MRPDVQILFLETGFQFAETLAFKAQLTERLGLTVTDLVGEYTVERQAGCLRRASVRAGPRLCCDINKVQPMLRRAPKLDAWITAFRRDSSPTRATAPILDRYELEPGRPMVKINPVANVDATDTWAYLKEHDLPHNPLYDLGYASIGCAPCTRMRFEGEPERAGRWAGLSKWECGIQQREASTTSWPLGGPDLLGDHPERVPRQRRPPGGCGRARRRRPPGPGTASPTSRPPGWRRAT